MPAGAGIKPAISLAMIAISVNYIILPGSSASADPGFSHVDGSHTMILLQLNALWLYDLVQRRLLMPKFYTKQGPEKKDDPKSKFVKLEGEKIDLFPDLDTFMYSDEDQDIEGAHPPFDVYHIVEACSGLAFAHGLFPLEAKQNAKKKYPPKQAIVNAVRKYGLSPAYLKFIDWPMLEQLIQRKREADKK